MFDTLLKASGYMGLQLLSWSFYLFVLGIVTAPVMAAIAGCMARSRGLDTSRYAFAAAGYSMLFFLPAVHLLVRLGGKQYPRVVFMGVYTLAYAIWIGTGVVAWIFILVEVWKVSINYPPIDSYTIVLSALVIPGPLACIYVLARSIRPLLRAYGDDQGPLARNALLDVAYIKPFAYSIIWGIAIIAVGLIGLSYGIKRT